MLCNVSDICDFHSSIDSWLCSNDDSEYNVKMSLQKCDNHSSVECENSGKFKPISVKYSSFRLINCISNLYVINHFYITLVL